MRVVLVGSLWFNKYVLLKMVMKILYGYYWGGVGSGNFVGLGV